MQTFEPENEELEIDISNIPMEQLESSTPEEVSSIILAAPKKEVEHAQESYFYGFSNPQILYIYLDAAAAIFPFILLSAVISSFLSIRRQETVYKTQGPI